MKSTPTLPENYKEILAVDLQKNKKLALLVNIAALAVSTVMAVLGIIFKPLDFDLLIENPLISILIIIATYLGILLYILLHELTHGVFIYHYSKKKPKFGFTLLYAYAGSDCYFAKLPYIIIALSPVIFWGLVLLVLNLTLPDYLFWPIYLIQIMNISGAAGDVYVTLKFTKLPKDILVLDTGIAMTVYSAEEV